MLASPLLLGTEARAIERVVGALCADGDPGPAISDRLITRPGDAVNVFDLRAVAEQRLLPAHYAYLSLGVDHEVTLRENRRGFEQFQLRPRRLVDTRSVDTKLELLGTELDSPIVLSPCGSQKAFHPEAELATARAARKRDHLMILSASSSSKFTEVVQARRGPLWLQLPYPARIRMATNASLEKAEEAGCPAVVLTVDLVGIGENRDRIDHFHRPDNPECQGCHGGALAKTMRGLGSFAKSIGLDPLEIASDTMVVDWEVVARIRDATKLKLVIKGILTHEDARLCVENGVDAIVVSNHGGRSEDSGLSTIEVLPGIADAVSGRIPILIDSGFRRGTDIFKALALGASAVCVGRPYLWGLSAFGQDGVETTLAMLQRELVMAMKAMGTPSLAAITENHVQARMSIPG
jgi:isopentenyl diphosphate isomerase/L-lactate dehydrogenase-like FMN-dependent dehydrogenase